MFIIDKEKNRILKIESTTFSKLGFKEREHLQEWIANNPDCLNEELLIIQKEFDGFNDTNERLDLLAVDKQGNLVVIENKMDDTGRDVAWQVLKYAAYCSTLNSSQIIEIYDKYLKRIGSQDSAEDSLGKYLESEDIRERLNSGNTQRIMLVAGNFRKEVTSTVLWLLNYGIRVQCFKATPYKLEDQTFINFEQIIPVKEAEEYTISMAKKSREEVGAQEELKEKQKKRFEFWSNYLEEINKVSKLFQNISPGKDQWISAGSGLGFAGYSTVITAESIRIELSIVGKSRDDNKMVYDKLHENRATIEEKFGKPLVWERLDDKKMSRIKCEKTGVSYLNQEDWPEIFEFTKEVLPKFESAIKPHLNKIRQKLKAGGTF